MARRADNYYSRRQAYEEQTGNKTYNILESMKIALDKPTDWDVSIPSELSNVGVETETAPTQQPSRPRALTIAYNPNTKVVYIVFRTNHWHQYNDVSTDIWLGLKGSPSTNDYLPTLEGNCSSHHAANVGDLSAGTLARLSESAARAQTMQKGKLNNWKAKDFFKD